MSSSAGRRIGRQDAKGGGRGGGIVAGAAKDLRPPLSGLATRAHRPGRFGWPSGARLPNPDPAQDAGAGNTKPPRVFPFRGALGWVRNGGAGAPALAARRPMLTFGPGRRVRHSGQRGHKILSRRSRDTSPTSASPGVLAANPRPAEEKM